MLLVGHTILLRWGVGCLGPLIVWASPGLVLVGAASALYVGWLSIAHDVPARREATIFAFAGAVAWVGVGSCTWYGLMGSVLAVLGAAIAVPTARVLSGMTDDSRAAWVGRWLTGPMAPAPMGWGVWLVIWGVCARSPLAAFALGAASILLIWGLARSHSVGGMAARAPSAEEAFMPSMWTTVAVACLLSAAPGAAWSRLSPPVAHLSERLDPPGGLRIVRLSPNLSSESGAVALHTSSP